MSTQLGDQYGFILLHKEAGKWLSLNEQTWFVKKIFIIFIVYTTPKLFYFSEQRIIVFLKKHKMF
jgi:hypothetical protein